jgi:5'-3' exonuclease
VLDAAGVRERFGVDPPLIPDYLALVGDSADGFPGIAGIGRVTAARLVNRYGPIEDFPADAFSEDQRELSLLFKDLATLRSGVDLFATAEELRFRGPTPAFVAVAEELGDARLAARSVAAAGVRQ